MNYDKIFNYVLVGLKNVQKNEKNYYICVIIDGQCNTFELFINQDQFIFLKENCLFKDITKIVNLRFDSQTFSYKPYINYKKSK